jgi:hypothetical protein
MKGFDLYNACWAVELPTTAKIVLLALAKHSGSNGRAFPSNARLRQLTGLSERAVRDAIRTLAQTGHITCHHAAGRHTTYQVHPRSIDGDAYTPVASAGVVGDEAGSPGTMCPSPRHLLPGTQAGGAAVTDHRTDQSTEELKKPLSPGGDEKVSGGKGEHSGKIVRPAALNVPYADIIAEYHRALPMMPQVRILTSARKDKIRQRWCEDERRQTIEFWTRFFDYVARSDFLTGRNDAWTGCDLEWLVTLGNFAKVIEGKYANKEQVSSSG